MTLPLINCILLGVEIIPCSVTIPETQSLKVFRGKSFGLISLILCGVNKSRHFVV